MAFAPKQIKKHISHRSSENLCGITEDSRSHSHGECLSGEHDGVLLDVEATHTGPAVADPEAQKFRPTRGLTTGHVHQGGQLMQKLRDLIGVSVDLGGIECEALHRLGHEQRLDPARTTDQR